MKAGSGIEKGQKVDFEKWWELYPRHVAKKRAELAWNRIVKHVTGWEIWSRTLHFMRTEWRGRDDRFIPYPATFLNSEDWSERTEILAGEHEIDAHLCEVCQPHHEWSGRPDLPYKATCPKQVQAMQLAISGARLKGMA